MSKPFKMLCYSYQCTKTKHGHAGKPSEKFENKYVSVCPDCHSILVKVSKRRLVKDKVKSVNRPTAVYGFKTRELYD